ncbi:TerB family tellurite resistance protein [Alphaproteobacteria bacterium]|nr:TerB family tellurite resistance protein [Alphaproteobacteria bacterium]
MFKKLFQKTNKIDNKEEDNRYISFYKIIFEIIAADHEIKDDEIQIASKLLEDFFGIEKSISILEFEKLRDNGFFNIDLTKITIELKKSLSYVERQKLIQICWQTLLVDKDEDVLETSTVRKISTLLGIEDQDFISIRNRVKKS